MVPNLPLHDELMRSAHKIQTVLAIPLFGDVGPEDLASAAGTHAPAWLVFRVTPEQVAHGSVVWHFDSAVQLPDHVQRLYVGAQPSMQTEYFAFHEGSQGKVVKQVREHFPDSRIALLAQTFVLESVDLGYLA